MPTFEISTTGAKQDKLFYVVANIIIVNSDDKTCLLIKRSNTEKVLPGKWAFPGGKLEHEDVKQLVVEAGVEPITGIDNILGKLAVREAKEECGLDVDENARVIKNKVFVRPDGIPVFMATLANEYRGGEVVIEDGAVTDFAWVAKDQLTDYDCVPGVVQEAELALA
jgi:8-oxo-dGTP pyrophosphatase MutT (NUDIX family)